MPYSAKKDFYRSTAVASHYDAERFVGPLRGRRNVRKWQRITAALDGLVPSPVKVLDLPCGTGRFTGPLAARGHTVIGSDISREMMGEAPAAASGAEAAAGFVQADAERLPFRDDGFDCVVSIRFMFHVDPHTRTAMLREFGRVARFQVIDYRHRYSYRYVRWRIRTALGLTSRPLDRVSRKDLEREFREAGLTVRGILPIARVFSDKWIVVGERA